MHSLSVFLSTDRENDALFQTANDTEGALFHEICGGDTDRHPHTKGERGVRCVSGGGSGALKERSARPQVSCERHTVV